MPRVWFMLRWVAESLVVWRVVCCLKWSVELFCLMSRWVARGPTTSFFWLCIAASIWPIAYNSSELRNFIIWYVFEYAVVVSGTNCFSICLKQCNYVPYNGREDLRSCLWNCSFYMPIVLEFSRFGSAFKIRKCLLIFASATPFLSSRFQTSAINLIFDYSNWH